MPGVHAEILVRVDCFSATYNETAERPLPRSNSKFPAPRVVQVGKLPDPYFLEHHGIHDGLRAVRPWRTTMTDRIIDGIPIAAA